MKQRKILRALILFGVSFGLAAALPSCKSTKRKGCGCGADLNRMYKPKR